MLFALWLHALSQCSALRNQCCGRPASKSRPKHISNSGRMGDQERSSLVQFAEKITICIDARCAHIGWMLRLCMWDVSVVCDLLYDRCAAWLQRVLPTISVRAPVMGSMARGKQMWVLCAMFWPQSANMPTSRVPPPRMYLNHSTRPTGCSREANHDISAHTHTQSTSFQSAPRARACWKGNPLALARMKSQRAEKITRICARLVVGVNAN